MLSMKPAEFLQHFGVPNDLSLLFLVADYSSYSHYWIEYILI